HVPSRDREDTLILSQLDFDGQQFMVQVMPRYGAISGRFSDREVRTYLSGKNSAISSLSRSKSIGLVTYSLQPASSASARDSVESCAETATIGTRFIPLFWRMLRVAARPSIFGRLRSIRIRAGRVSTANFTACSPSVASTTEYPAISSNRLIMKRLSSKTSTTRNFFLSRFMSDRFASA